MIYPICVTDAVVPERHVDLLLHELGGIQHYSTIKNFSRVFSGQLSNHGHVIYCCKKCLHAYSSEEMLASHSAECCHVQRTKFPKDPRCIFTNIQKQLQAPFVVYADSILKPVSEEVDVTQGVGVGVESSTTVFQEHIPCSFAYKIVSSVDPDLSRPLVMYRGEDAAEKFVQKLQLEAQQLCEEFRKTCLDFYSHDPLHYYTTPGLAWDAALRMSRVDLQLITDENMYNFVENSIRGGISMISTRYAKANNPTISDTYDSNLPNQDLIYLDANNLYGWAMSQFLSTHGFRFLATVCTGYWAENEQEWTSLQFVSADDIVIYLCNICRTEIPSLFTPYGNV